VYIAENYKSLQFIALQRNRTHYWQEKLHQKYRFRTFTPGLRKELWPLLELRFAPRENYQRQDPNNKNSTQNHVILKNKPFHRVP
jgi:hypothetical protein